MSGKQRGLRASEKWLSVVKGWERDFPSLSADCLFSKDLIGLHIKVRDDGTLLGVLKKYGPDGGPLVTFGTGYDVVLCMMALEASVRGDNWRVDKPWSPSKR